MQLLDEQQISDEYIELFKHVPMCVQVIEYEQHNLDYRSYLGTYTLEMVSFREITIHPLAVLVGVFRRLELEKRIEYWCYKQTRGLYHKCSNSISGSSISSCSTSNSSLQETT